MYCLYYQKEEPHLRDVIHSLDEKLREIKKKYSDEMRRSLHTQSERIQPFFLFLFCFYHSF